jgi:hypothetical protein
LGVEEKVRAKDNWGKKVEGGSSANMVQKKNPHAFHNNKKVKPDVKPKATTNFKKKGKGKGKRRPLCVWQVWALGQGLS